MKYTKWIIITTNINDGRILATAPKKIQQQRDDTPPPRPHPNRQINENNNIGIYIYSTRFLVRIVIKRCSHNPPIGFWWMLFDPQNKFTQSSNHTYIVQVVGTSFVFPLRTLFGSSLTASSA